jgi:metal-dependent amidase/aminoacylase/carboxypeptidase family protein
MIKDGCLEGVDEVYGCHNWPSHPVGYCIVKSGAMMSEGTQIDLKIYGKGGHGSTPEKCVDPA